MAQAQLVRRIDRNSVVGDKEAMLKLALSDTSKTHFLYRVGGIAIGVVRGSGQFGDWIKLVGRFKAINYNDDQFVAGVAFLPPDMATMIATRLEASDDPQPQQVFLFDVFLRYDKSLATSYGFIVEPVRPEGTADPLDELFSTAKALPAPETQKALEAPSKKK